MKTTFKIELKIILIVLVFFKTLGRFCVTRKILGKIAKIRLNEKRYKTKNNRDNLLIT